MTAGGIAVSAVGSLGSRFGRLEWISLAFALLWSIGLVIAAFRLPAYQSLSISGHSLSFFRSHPGTGGSATLVAVNGWGGVVVAAAPLAAAVLIACALWRRIEEEGAGALAWTVTVLLMCFNVLGMLSIGLFVIPVTLALIVACVNHGRTRMA
jgi:hypothetical protein